MEHLSSAIGCMVLKTIFLEGFASTQLLLNSFIRSTMNQFVSNQNMTWRGTTD
jgi:hypothetical protein